MEVWVKWWLSVLIQERKFNTDDRGRNLTFDGGGVVYLRFESLMARRTELCDSDLMVLKKTYSEGQRIH